MLAALLLGWVLSQPAKDLPFDQPDLTLHPHTDQETTGQQNPCGTGPQATCTFSWDCGSVGTTFDLFLHRVRCQDTPGVPPSVMLPVGTPCYLFVGGGPDLTHTVNGWSLVSSVVAVWPATAFAQGGQGVARWTSSIPSDPTLAGQRVYFQAGASIPGGWRESGGGYLEIEP